jgi:serine/threonine protein phosphatase 1
MVYVCSDLHGCSPQAFQKLLDQAGFGEDDFLFILGDVIDRGSHGAEFLLWLTQQPNIQLILGNHEAMMLACSFLFEEANEDTLDQLSVANLELLENWMDNGGRPTLRGFRQLLKEDPESVYGILDYLRDCPLFEVVQANGKNFILVHAGLGNYRPDRPLEDYTPEELLMARPEPENDYALNAHVIFGHTPTCYFGSTYAGRPIHTKTWSCIDVGVSFGFSPMLLRLDDWKEFYLQE